MGHNNAAIGETYEAVGPERMTQAELLTYMYALTSRTDEDLNFRIAELMIDPITFAKAFVAQTIKIGNVKVFHQTSLDRLERDSISDTSDLGLPDITIFRCADVYGQGDNFINFWFSMMRKTVKSGISLYGKGELTVKQPLYRGDLVDAVMASLHNPAAIGETYEALGPE